METANRKHNGQYAKREVFRQDRQGSANAGPPNNAAVAAGSPAGPGLPKKQFRSVEQLMAGISSLVSGVLRNSDIAFRSDRRFQRMMRRDPDVMTPLMMRQMAVALLEFDIVPEDESDTQQVDQAKALTRALEHKFRRWPDFIRHMEEAVFYGPSAANLVYDRVADTGDGIKFAPTNWLPFHPDSLAYTAKGQLGVQVHATKFLGPAAPGERGFVHLFNDTDRRAIVSHTFMAQGADFEEPLETRYMWSGRGLRDVMYFDWLIKQTIFQLLVNYLERYAMGNRIGTYPASNPEAASAIEDALENLAGDVSVIIPKDEEGLYGIEILQPGGSQSKIFFDILQGFLVKRFKELFVGQTGTSETSGSNQLGDGSGVAKAHEQTFNRIIRFDALNLADSLTHELIRPMSEFNFGPTPYYPRLEFNLEEVEAKDFMDAVQTFVDIGGEVAEGQVRGKLGLDVPKDGEPALSKASMIEAGTFEGLLGGGAEFEQTQNEAFKMFDAAFKKMK